LDGVPGSAVLVADAGVAECVLDDGVDPAEMGPGIEALAASGWEVTVLVPARRMGAAHWGLRGAPVTLQPWWPGPADSIQFGQPQVP
jgi:broad specificity polyphosphatase/5'/3'-nucleotidase SurE